LSGVRTVLIQRLGCLVVSSIWGNQHLYMQQWCTDMEILHQCEVSRTFANRTYDWMRGSSKKFELSRGDKETIFFTAMDRKAISERLETLINEKNHIQMQNKPPKQKTTTLTWPIKRKINRFHPNFPHNQRAHILYHCFSCFIQIPYLSKLRATLFGINRFCTKCKACSLRADSL